MKHLIRKSTALALLFSIACAPKDPTLQSRESRDPAGPAVLAPVSQQATVVRKVDILFVVDTSESMVVHQENLKENIDRFVESFQRKANVDFHIGVVSVWDSGRYNDPKVVAIKNPYPLGMLRPLKDPAQPGQPVAGAQFVTRIPRFSEVLGETLKVGIEPRFNYTTDRKGRKVQSGDAGGPEDEELFSPVLPALKAAFKENEGFYRKDAHLAVVMITDADDSTPNLSGDQFAQLLIEEKGDYRLVSGYAALALDDNRTTCVPDPGRRKRDPVTRDYVKDENGNYVIEQPEKILEFVARTSGRTVDLCAPNFGEKLGEIGRMIEEKASALMHIQLERKPDMKTLSVTYLVNGQSILLKGGEDYSYVGDTNEILVHGDSPTLSAQPGGEVKIDFTPINWKRFKQGHVKKAGQK